MSMRSVNPKRVELPQRPLRRLGRELILLVLAKITLLLLLWWIVISPYARPDTRPAAIERLLAPTGTSSPSHPDSP